MNDRARLSTWRKTAYGTGQLAEGIVSIAFMIYVLFFYNQVLGMSGTSAGLAMFIALLFDAVSDPLMGAISDRTRSRLGRRHPYLYLAIIPLPVAFFLLFSPPPGLGEAELFLWLTSFAVLSRLAMSIFFVPHLALGAELSSDYHERNQIVAYRQFFSMLGYLATLAIGFGVFFVPSVEFVEGQLNPRAYAPFAAMMGIILAISMLVSAAGTHACIPDLPAAKASSIPGHSATYWSELTAGLRNRSFRVLLLALLIFYVAFGIRTTLSLHLYTHYWLLSTAEIELVVVSGILALAAGIILWAFASKLLEKRTAFIIGLAGWVLLTAWPVLQKMLNIYPDRQEGAYVDILLWTSIAASIMGAGTNIFAGSMIADCLDENELLTGKRQEGAFFGAFTLAAKATTGLGVWLSGVALDIIGFPANAAPGSIEETTLQKLAILTGPVLVMGGLSALLIVVRYNLSHERHIRIQEALRRARRPVAPNDPSREGQHPQGQSPDRT